MISLFTQAANLRPHEFVFVAPEGTKKVSVAGTFNAWNKDAQPMSLDADGRTFRRKVDLPVGKVLYKFVLDDTKWIVDPKGKTSNDGNGNDNTILFVWPSDYGSPARPGDGELARSAIYHDQTPSWLNLDRNRLTFKIQARADDVEKAALVIGGKPIVMTRTPGDELYETWSASVPYSGKSFAYAFRLDGMEVGSYRFSSKAYKPFKVAPWVEDSVIYQIFPDRFANGDPANDPKNVQAWDAKPTYGNRLGGDAAGIRSHIAYLKNLGVSAVFFNPVFKSPSNHRYEADDFRLIDPEIGTNKEFGDLTAALQKTGIRTVMDWSLDHSSPNFFAFKDVREKGATSPYSAWYNVYSYPVKVQTPPNYEAWYGYPSMPKFRLMNPEVTKYLLDLVGFWRQQAPGLGGIRLDVADQMDPAFWRLFRKEVKEQDPNLWLVGERWSDARPWLQGDQWDAAMNYPFRDAAVGWIAEGKTKPSQFLNRLFEVYGWYAPQVNRSMMNLLGSHDTPRFRTVAGGDERLAMLGATALLTWVGAPNIYYGDEVGMEGERDPDNRRGMRWDLVRGDNHVLSHYRKLIAARRASKALREGDPVRLLADDTANVAAYGRTTGSDAAIVALNRSSETRQIALTLPQSLSDKTYRDALTGGFFKAQHSISLSLPPYGSAVLVVRNASMQSSLRPCRCLESLETKP
ncbi:alpha-glycosidase [soil metagenome]